MYEWAHVMQLLSSLKLKETEWASCLVKWIKSDVKYIILFSWTFSYSILQRVQLPTFLLTFPTCSKFLVLYYYFFFFLHMYKDVSIHVWLTQDNPPRDFVLAHFLHNVFFYSLKFHVLSMEYKEYLAYFTCLTLAKNTLKMHSPLLYVECNLLNWLQLCSGSSKGPPLLC